MNNLLILEMYCEHEFRTIKYYDGVALFDACFAPDPSPIMLIITANHVPNPSTSNMRMTPQYVAMINVLKYTTITFRIRCIDDMPQGLCNQWFNNLYNGW